jgi:biotin transport system substrate-specific component
MLRTLPNTRDARVSYRLASVGVFTVLTIIAAQISIPLQPVPFTLQVLAVLFSGLVLGARDGGLSQLIYIGLIAMNLPVAAQGMGAAALAGPTAGYLFGFVPAAFVTGLIAERSANRVWQRWLAGIVGIGVIYLCGIVVLKSNLSLTWEAAWVAGVAPFVVLDLTKALIAAALAEGGRARLMRQV